MKNRVVTTRDVTAEAERWPVLAAHARDQPVRAVLGVPVRLGGVPVGTLDVYQEQPHDWDESEVAALERYAEVIATTLTAALHAHTAGELARQLQYALDYRVLIERGVGYLMAKESLDAVAAFKAARRRAQPSNEDRPGRRARPRDRQPARLTDAGQPSRPFVRSCGMARVSTIWAATSRSLTLVVDDSRRSSSKLWCWSMP